MMTKSILLAAAATLVLSACATHQENPNYQYSSRYDDGTTTTNQMAGATNTAPVSVPVVSQTSPYQAPTQQSATYQNTQQQTYPVQTYQQQPYHAPQAVYVEDARMSDPTPSSAVTTARPVAPAPTDSQYAGQAVHGTPGYGVYQAEEIQYDYSQNVVTARTGMPYTTAANQPETRALTPAPSITVPSPILSDANYVVKQGDTIYNLSKRLCVDINEVTGINMIGQDYAIQIGQPLRLPNSRC